MEFKGTKRLDQLNENEIRYIQEKLGVEVDGILGPNTKKAWYDFKRDNNLDEWDLVGEYSFTLLKSALNWNNFESKVSKYFTVGEVSNHSFKRIVKNVEHRNNVLKLAKELDKIRELFGPIVITSWYRPPDENRRVGGTRNSQHLTGLAADIITPNKDLIYVEDYLNKFWQGRLGRGARNPKKRFIHLDLGNPGMLIPSIGLVNEKVDLNKVTRWDY